MKRIAGLILKILIYIIKNINKNAGMLIDILENMYALTVNVKTKTLEKMIKVLLLIVGGKIMEIVVDNKIVTVVEIIKIINNYITLNDVWVLLELWVIWIVYIVKMNTNIILINVNTIILKMNAAKLNGITRITKAAEVLGDSLLWIVLNLHYAQNKGVRSCIPFV
ncbi:MAG: hypothetical protein IPI31_13325 [Bacteroidetes bacterium]|nr:hypothetical protein [Bacteroidota bacterium]